MVRLQQTTTLIVAMALTTFASGAALVWLRTWSGTPARYLTGAGIMVALFGVGRGFSKPVCGGADAETARRLRAVALGGRERSDDLAPLVGVDSATPSLPMAL